MTWSSKYNIKNHKILMFLLYFLIARNNYLSVFKFVLVL